mmetsp:Transcript_3616/g.12925  ORF Transcript_3616/g.12925 Transcript_3616/m.12925 type:complete len:657 (-) Transcript_3616:1051-3021(-)
MTDTDALGQADNVGIYDEKSGRRRLIFHRPTMCNIIVFHFRRVGHALLQMQLRHSPLNWPPWSAVQPTVFAPRPDVQRGETVSEKSLLEKEVQGFLTEQFLEVQRRMRQKDDGSWEDPFEKEVVARMAEEDKAAKDAQPDDKKVCPKCLTVHQGDPDIRRTTCKYCTDSIRLPTLALSRREQGTGTAEAQRFRAAREAQLESAAKYKLSGAMESDKCTTQREVYDVDVDLLPIINLNPSTLAAKKEVADHFGSMLKVRGFCPDDQVKREWAFIGGDEGATDDEMRQDPKDPEMSSKYARFVHVIGTGHEEFCFLRVLSGISWHVTGDVLAEAHGMVKPGGKNLLHKAFDHHKSRVFLLFQRIAITRELMREYFLSCWGEKTVEGFNTWLNDASELDATTAFLGKFFIRREMSAMTLYHYGIRQNEYRSYSAGRKMLTPTLYARNANKYAPRIIKDIAIHEGRLTREVREMREDTLSLHGQGYDMYEEQDNKAAKSYMHGNTEQQWRIASVLRAVAPVLRSKLAKEVGMSRSVRAQGTSHAPTDLTRDLENAAEWFIRNKRPLSPQAGRTNLVSLRGDELLKDSNLYYEQGMMGLQVAVVALLNKTHEPNPVFPKHPTPVPFVDAERRKTVATDSEVENRSLQDFLEELEILTLVQD